MIEIKYNENFQLNKIVFILSYSHYKPYITWGNIYNIT